MPFGTGKGRFFNIQMLLLCAWEVPRTFASAVKSRELSTRILQPSVLKSGWSLDAFEARRNWSLAQFPKEALSVNLCLAAMFKPFARRQLVTNAYKNLACLLLCVREVKWWLAEGVFISDGNMFFLFLVKLSWPKTDLTDASLSLSIRSW